MDFLSRSEEDFEHSEYWNRFQEEKRKQSIDWYHPEVWDDNGREIVYKGTSEVSGDFIVEDITDTEGQIFRRLIFMNSPFEFQSQAWIKIVQHKKVVDVKYVACPHYLYMAVGAKVAADFNTDEPKALIIGLGGGGLCTFLLQAIKNLHITAIDIDKTILDIATNFFGLKLSSQLDVVIENGLKYLENAEKGNKTYDIIIFDVDSKDSSLGLSCPPKEFIDPTVISAVKSLLTNDGIFIINLACRDKNLKSNIIEILKMYFPVLLKLNLEIALNDIIFCVKNTKDLKMELLQAAVKFNQDINLNQLNSNEQIDIEEFNKTLVVL